MALPTPYTHPDGRNLHLGKGPAKSDSRRFMLSNFLALAPPPVSVNWFGSVTEYGEMLNDSLGDCTCAAVGHAEQVASLNTPEGELTFPDNIILNLYEKSCGYVFNDPSTDNGGVITDVLDWVRKYGMGKKHDTPDIHRKKILYAYADPNPNDVTHIKQAIAEVGIVDIGLQLPITAQSQVGKVWDVVGDPNSNNDSRPGSWGGHSTIVAAYNANTVTCITWGQLQPMTWDFWNTYVDESHALLMHSWLDRQGATSAVNLAALEAALQALNN
jgi:hypothetical protein